MRDKIKKQCKDKSDINELLQKEILNTTKYSVTENSIPGLILPDDFPKKPLADDKKIVQLNYISNVISKKMVDNKLSKDEICYIILTLLSNLGLNDDDFKNFNKKYGINNPEDDDRDDEDDEDPPAY